MIKAALIRRLYDADVADPALRLLFHFQGPDLMQAEEHPAGQVFFPMVVMTDVLRDRVALPSEVTYRLADANRSLQPDGYGFEFRDNEYYSFALSNQMRSDAIFSAWYQDKPERIEGIEKEIRARLWGANSLVSGTREALEKAGALFAYPPKFELPDSFRFSEPILSRLAFLAQYESTLAYVESRSRRMAPRDEQIRVGDAVALRYEGGHRFAVEGISPDLELQADGFPSHLIAASDEEGSRALLSFDDFWNRDRVWIRRGLKLRLSAIDAVEGSPPGPWSWR